MSLSRRDWLAIALAAAGGLAVVGGSTLAIGTLVTGADGDPVGVSSAFPSGSPGASAGASAAAAADLVIDVQGAVRRPGVVLLPAGSRVADALQAAGGYARNADLNAAAASLNLAATLADGVQVYVPVIGIAAQPGGGTGSGSGGSGLINLNTATPEELESLPGIGPVTAQKIVAARAEQPFTTLDELLARDVMNSGQLEDIRDLVTL